MVLNLGKSFENNIVSKNRYLYNGKELQDQVIGGTALEWYDYGALYYDPEIGRFTCLDPIATDFPYVTPYNYAGNKVINCIDLWGIVMNF